jgi:hypothetical protein
MDSFLRKLYYQDVSRLKPYHWHGNNLKKPVQYRSQELVLIIWRTFIEDLFLFDDPVAELRKTDLTTSLTSVMVHAEVLQKLYSQGRSSDETQESSQPKTDALLYSIRADPTLGWLDVWNQSIMQLNDMRNTKVLPFINLEKTVLVPLTSINQILEQNMVEADSLHKLLVTTLNTIAPTLSWIPVSYVYDLSQ